MQTSQPGGEPDSGRHYGGEGHRKSEANPSSGRARKLNDMEQHDLVLLDSGVGGKVGAGAPVGQSQRVAVIERQDMGGSCRT